MSKPTAGRVPILTAVAQLLEALSGRDDWEPPTYWDGTWVAESGHPRLKAFVSWTGADDSIANQTFKVDFIED